MAKLDVKFPTGNFFAHSKLFLDLKMSCFEAKLAIKFWLISGYFGGWEVEFWLNLANPGAFSGSGDFFNLAALFVTTNDCCRFLFPVAVLPNARPGKLS